MDVALVPWLAREGVSKGHLERLTAGKRQSWTPIKRYGCGLGTFACGVGMPLFPWQATKESNSIPPVWHRPGSTDFTSIFSDRTSFRTKGLPSSMLNCKKLRQFLADRTSFLRKGYILWRLVSTAPRIMRKIEEKGEKRARGQENKRARGQEGKRAREQENKRARGQEGKRARGQEKIWDEKIWMWDKQM